MPLAYIDDLSPKDRIELVKKGICVTCGKGTEVNRARINGRTIQYFSCGHSHTTVEIKESLVISDQVKEEVSSFPMDGVVLGPKKLPEVWRIGTFVSGELTNAILQTIQRSPVGAPVIINIQGNVSSLNVGDNARIFQATIGDIVSSFNKELQRSSDIDEETRKKAINELRALQEGVETGNITLNRAKEIMTFISSLVAVSKDLTPYVGQLWQFVRNAFGWG